MTAERTVWLATAPTAKPHLFAPLWMSSELGGVRHKPPARPPASSFTHTLQKPTRETIYYAAAGFQGSGGVVGKLVSDKSSRGGGDQEANTHTQKYIDIPPSNTHFHMHLKQNKAKATRTEFVIIIMVLHANNTINNKNTHAHSLSYTHTHLGTLVHIFKTPTAMFTHLRSTAARNHDNASGHNSPYCLKWSLIFSSLSQQSGNDMLELQPPRTATMVNYHPPSENARQRLSWRRAGLQRRLWPRRRRWRERVTVGGEAAHYSSEHTRRMHEVHGNALGRGFMGWRSLYWPLAMRKGI